MSELRADWRGDMETNFKIKCETEGLEEATEQIDRQAAESIPYEEYRLFFDHVMHTSDGKTIRIGLPLQCKLCALTDSGKQFVAMEIEKLFEKMYEAVMREEQYG